MQFASKDTTIMSINNLIKEVQKKPKNMLTLAQIAENTFPTPQTAATTSFPKIFPFINSTPLTFSHFTSFERATKHSELILKMPDILNDLYEILNNDPKHLKSLQDGIK